MTDGIPAKVSRQKGYRRHGAARRFLSQQYDAFDCEIREKNRQKGIKAYYTHNQMVTKHIILSVPANHCVVSDKDRRGNFQRPQEMVLKTLNPIIYIMCFYLNGSTGKRPRRTFKDRLYNNCRYNSNTFDVIISALDIGVIKSANMIVY